MGNTAIVESDGTGNVRAIECAGFREHSGAVVGSLFTAALTGGMLMPWIAGLIAEASGIRFVFLMASANFMAIAILSECVRRIRSGNGPRS